MRTMGWWMAVYGVELAGRGFKRLGDLRWKNWSGNHHWDREQNESKVIWTSGWAGKKRTESWTCFWLRDFIGFKNFVIQAEINNSVFRPSLVAPWVHPYPMAIYLNQFYICIAVRLLKPQRLGGLELCSAREVLDASRLVPSRPWSRSLRARLNYF